MHQVITSFITLNRKWILFGLALWAMSMLLNIWPLVFLAVFCILNALMLTYDRYIELPIDIELSTFAAVLMTLKFGIMWGVSTAIMSKVVAMIYNRDFNKNSLFAIAGYCVAAVLAGLFAPITDNIVAVGVLVTVLVNIFNFFTCKFVVFLSDYELFLYGGSNLIFNVTLFIGFSEIIMKLINIIL